MMVFARILKWIFLALSFVLVLDVAYLVFLWQGRQVTPMGAVPESHFIEAYKEERSHKPELPHVRWNPVPLTHIPEHVVKAFIIAEDTQFFVHHGFDLGSIKLALEDSWNKKRLTRGASTISQQTAKNLFLTPERALLRKWHELILTAVLEARLSKHRILEIYLNVAEFGVGVYGVKAAAHQYWQRPVSRLTTQQAAQLAAALPWPQRHNPATRTNAFLQHAKRIHRRMQTESYPTRR